MDLSMVFFFNISIPLFSGFNFKAKVKGFLPLKYDIYVDDNILTNLITLSSTTNLISIKYFLIFI